MLSVPPKILEPAFRAIPLGNSVRRSVKPTFSHRSTTSLYAWAHGICPLCVLSLAAVGWGYLGGFGFGIPFFKYQVLRSKKQEPRSKKQEARAEMQEPRCKKQDARAKNQESRDNKTPWEIQISRQNFPKSRIESLISWLLFLGSTFFPFLPYPHRFHFSLLVQDFAVIVSREEDKIGQLTLGQFSSIA